MLGRTNTGGGGGGGLNFKVIPNPMPSTAKENTIWVDTDKINNYYFSAEQPENMVDYEVWFPIGTSSTVAFSATKKNSVMVYPISAKQMVSGALVDKTAKIWQGGEWVDWWNGELYDSGNQYEAITGGWVGTHTISGSTSSGSKLTVNNDHLSVTNVSGGSFGVVTSKKIDMTNFSRIYAEVTGQPRLSVADVYPTSTSNFLADFAASSVYTGKTVIYVEIAEVPGEHFVAIASRTNSSTPLEIYKVWME